MKTRVLVLEDDLVLAEMIEYLLADNGFEVRKAATAENGLALAPIFRPQIMLIDISLPDGDGLDVLERLRNDPRLSNLRAFIVSSYKSKATRVRAETLGALSYWTKPFESQALLAVVQEAAASS